MLALLFLYNQGLSHTSGNAQTPVFERVLGHFRIKEHYVHDIGTEELGHLEMIGTIVYQLTRNLTEKQIQESGFDAYFVDHGTGIFPVSAAGVPFSAGAMASKGDVIADLNEDLAADGAIV